MKNIYGIDLGTTNSCIAIIDDNGMPLVITNKEGKPTTPSVVFFSKEGEVIVGNAARNMMRTRPERVVAFIKREMPNKGYSRKIGDINIDPVDISSLIIKKLVDDANTKRKNEEGKEAITRVVVTVPAYFGDFERRRTEDACKKAGLEVLELVGEPIAAALSYLTTQFNNKTVLVYDLGGGTFDVSILKIENEKIQTLAVEGDHSLGGIDWDRIIVKLALAKAEISEQPENFENTSEGGNLLLLAEETKINLSDISSTSITFIYGGASYTVDIDRHEFEELTTHLLFRTEKFVNRAIEGAVEDVKKNYASQQSQLLNSDGTLRIDEIIMVGGSTRMLMIEKMLKNKYKIAPKLVDPDYAVAKGAALQAKNIVSPLKEGEKGIVINRVKGSRSYGMSTYYNDEPKISNLILKTDDMVVERTYNSFSTRNDDQKAVSIAIYENESTDEYIEPSWGELVKEDTITWGYPVAKGTRLSVIVSRNRSGIIHVKAGCEGKEINMEIP